MEYRWGNAKKTLSHARMKATIAGLLTLFIVEIHWLYLLG